MEVYPLDIAAEQVVLWLLKEEQSGRHELSIVAGRIFSKEDVPRGDEAGFGTEEKEDLHIFTEIGSLEVSTTTGEDGWVLRLRVEDPLGPGLPEDDDMLNGEEEIDLATFYNEFIKPERGTAFVSLEAENNRAKKRFEKILDLMRKNQHKI